ncbi:protoporphyrinogen oxidase [Myxococcota bacterium]|nr:protoporphyrinogen oxidase [Myxococcota bacterium]
MPEMIVIGAGVSGLSTAVTLRADGWSVRVLEAGDSPGGNVRSERVEGRVLDRAANGWLDNEPAMDRLLTRLGLHGRVIRASDRYKTRWIWAMGERHPAPLSPPALLKTRLLSWPAKLRLLLEPLLPRRVSDEDESLADFVRRRLGEGLLDRMIAPMVTGIFAADPERLSLAAAFPRMAELEREHRSLFLAMLRLRRGGAPAGHLVTFDGGAGSLPEALAASLGDAVSLGTPALSLARVGEGWRVRTPHGELHADAVALACPGFVQAELLRPLDPAAAAALAEIPYAPVAVVVTASPRGAWAWEPEGFGVLKARGEDLGGALGAVFTSCVFPDQAQGDEHLIRTILGGAIHPEAALGDDQVLIGRARAALATLCGGERHPPHLTRVFRHPRGIPQYLPGHPARVRAARGAEERLPGLFLTGNHLDGVGVKDGARGAELLTARARALLTPRG